MLYATYPNPRNASLMISHLQWEIPWRRAWQPSRVFLPGESLGQGSLVGYSSWGPKGIRHNLATKQQQNKRINCDKLTRAKKTGEKRRDDKKDVSMFFERKQMNE